MQTQRIVINEMRAWRKRLEYHYGLEALIISSTSKVVKRWRIVAVAFDPTTKRDRYLIVKDA
jgi:hypothetical protein